MHSIGVGRQTFAAARPRSLAPSRLLGFTLTLPDAAPPVGSFASGFSVALLDASLNAALPSRSADNLALLFTLDPGAAPRLQTFTAATVNTVSAVPEPSSVALLLLGLIGIAGASQRRLRKGR